MKAPVFTQAALLETLLLGKGYGSSLAKHISNVTNGAMRLKSGSLFPALLNLEEDGLIQKVSGEVRSGIGRPRVYYELTSLGKQIARENRKIVLAIFSDSKKEEL